MKNHSLLTLSALLLTAGLVSCGGTSSNASSTPASEPKSEPASVASMPTEKSSDQQTEKIKLVDPRLDAYVAVLGSYENSGFEEYDSKTFKSLYEAINYVLEEGDPGSYVHLASDESKTTMYTKPQASYDIWHYYKNGNMLDGFYTYIAGDVEFFKGEDYTRVVCSNGYAGQTYQPYELLGHETQSTQAWNRLPLLDASARYNPHAFTGIQDTTYTIELSKAKIRPSYAEGQNAIPEISMSTTDSYNWSNQGIYMDTGTGEWHYFFGETQSDFKSFTYSDDDPILTSTWDEKAQEWTPDGDIRISLSAKFDEEEETVSNDFIVEVIKNGQVDSKNEFNYEYNQMSMRGTHRMTISLDLVPSDEDNEEEALTPDFMCGSYFKNVVVSEGKGTVREGLTDEIYQGDLPMCCEAGKTYDLLHALGGHENDSDTEVIIDNTHCVKYTESADHKDVWNISYEQSIAEALRSEEVEEVEDLIRMIPEGATTSTDEFRTAYAAFNALHEVQQELIRQIDKLTTIDDIIEGQ